MNAIVKWTNARNKTKEYEFNVFKKYIYIVGYKNYNLLLL